ncbi:MAG: hypothetical protein H3C34_29450, partial [Caldilineaceae bacterium]|nr:hypothetical protein [Caldilineaceae bacterium]
MKIRHRLAVLVCMLLLSSLASQPAVAGPQAFPLAQGNVSPCADHNTFLPMIWGSANNAQVAADPGDPSDDEGTPSAAIIVPRDLSLTSINELDPPVVFDVSCAELAMTPGNVAVFVNDRLLESNAYYWTPNTIHVDHGIDLGPQRIRIVAEDVKGGIVNAEMVLWFGSYVLEVALQDSGGQPVNGADVTVKMGDDQSVSVTAKTENGVATFSNMPDRTVYLEAKAAPNRFASLATIGSAGSVTLTLSDIGPASPIDNNDFSKGTDGWNIGSAPVQIVPHQETAASGASVAADDMDLVLNT